MYRLKSPLRVNFEITEACNIACVHCYNYWRYQETGEKKINDNHFRSYDHFEKMLTILIEQEVRTITFTGGEPFIRKDVLFGLVRKAKESGLCVIINTNATLISPDDIEILKQIGVDGYLVSLLSSDEKTHNRMTNANCYTKTIKSIERLVASDQTVSINMVTSTDNYQQVRSTAKTMSEMGVFSFSATPMLPCYLSTEHEKIHLTSKQVKEVIRDMMWVKNNLPLNVTILDTVVHCMFTNEERIEFEQLLGERYCCAGISDCALSPDGDLRPCILATDIGGNILVDGWSQSWERLAKWKEPSMIPSECLTCAVVDSCGGGCRAAAKAKYGNYNDKDPYMTVPIVEKPNSKPAIFKCGNPIRNDDTLTVFPGFQWREEPFGASLLYMDDFIFLESDAAAFLKVIISNEAFSVSSISEQYGIPESDIKYFFQELVDKGYLLVLNVERR